MPKFNLYSAWMDPVFYVWALVFAAAVAGLVFSLRKYAELRKAAPLEADGAEEENNPFVDAPAAEQPDIPADQPELPAEQPELPVEEPAAEAAPAPVSMPASAEASGGNKAETFVRGIYEGISGIDARLKGIESRLSKGSVNNEFTVKFLEDIIQDIDNLDKTKIKARIEYLVKDLKK